MNASLKHFWMSGAWAPPAVVVVRVSNSLPAYYLAEPKRAQEMANRVSGATVADVVAALPELLVRRGRAQELASKWTG